MRKISVLALPIFLAITLQASAHGDSGIQKVRHNYMEALGGHMGVIGEIVKHKLKMPGHIEMHAAGIAAVADRILENFPKGSGGGDSDAKDSIWKNWKDFKAKAASFKKAALELASVSKSKNMSKIGPAIGKLGKSCKGCHETYKED